MRAKAEFKEPKRGSSRVIPLHPLVAGGTINCACNGTNVCSNDVCRPAAAGPRLAPG
jgi:hypothetical protein